MSVFWIIRNTWDKLNIPLILIKFQVNQVIEKHANCCAYEIGLCELVQWEPPSEIRKPLWSIIQKVNDVRELCQNESYQIQKHMCFYTNRWE